MTVQFLEKLDNQKTWNNIQDMIKTKQLNYDLWKQVQTVLTHFDGQKITKRIQTALQKELPDYTIHYSTEYGLYSLYIWGNGIAYDQRKQYHIGHVSFSDILNMVKVLDSNQCWELEKSRYEKLQTLTEQDILTAVDKWNTGLTALQEVNNWAAGFEINYSNCGFDVYLRN